MSKVIINFSYNTTDTLTYQHFRLDTSPINHRQEQSKHQVLPIASDVSPGDVCDMTLHSLSG